MVATPLAFVMPDCALPAQLVPMVKFTVSPATAAPLELLTVAVTVDVVHPVVQVV
jgi:hypothetical protein